MSSQEGPFQDALFAASSRTGQVIARDVYANPEGAAVSIQERNLNLISCLGNFAALSSLDGLLRQDILKLRETYRAPGVAEAVLQNAAAKRLRLDEETRTIFGVATGKHEAVAFGLGSERIVHAVTNGMYSDFRNRYYGAKKHDVARDYITELSKQVDDIQSAVSLYNREHGFRPHKSEDIPPGTTKDVKDALEELNSRQRMQAIFTDPRAAFLPATNREKTTVMSFLDYLDNPEYPWGINNQLYECLLRQQKQRTDREGLSVYESKTWEIGDYLADAARGYATVARLLEDIEDVSPTLQFHEVEEFVGHDEAIAYLLRYDAIQYFVKTGNSRGGLKDVLRTQEFGRITRGSDPGKHKTVHSHFTMPAGSIPEATAAYMGERRGSMTVKELRTIGKKSMKNDINRGRFMWHRLHEVLAAPHLREYPIRFARVGNAAHTSLRAVENEPLVQLIVDEYSGQAA